MIPKELKSIPHLGVGMGLRVEIAKQTLSHKKEIDVLEIISEQYFSDKVMDNRTFLDKVANDFPIIPHGVKLSIGSVDEVEPWFLNEIKQLVRSLKASYYSDHFALTRFGDTPDTNHLSPLWYTQEMMDHVIKKIDTVQQFLGVPLVLENITAPFVIGEADYEEPEFLTEVCKKTGCGLLLDLTNIHINAFNQKKDAIKLLERYPLEMVVQIHLAGGEMHHGSFKDTHSQELTDINEGVWDLVSFVADKVDLKAVIIERDQNFKVDFEEMILNDLRKAKKILKKP